MRRQIRILFLVTVLLCAACGKPVKEESAPTPSPTVVTESAPPETIEPERIAEPVKEPETPLASMTDYQVWIRDVGYPSGEMYAGDMSGSGVRYYTSKDAPGYDSGRIVIGDSRCVQLGIYQQRAAGNEFAVFGTWGGHYMNWDPYLPNEEFQTRVEDCFHAQIEARGTCDLYFYATVNDYDFRDNDNGERVEAALWWAEQLASLTYEYEGRTYMPNMTVIGIAAGSRDGSVMSYTSEEFNRYEDAFNELLKEAVSSSEVLQDAEWTTVPEILHDEIGFMEDGLHYNDETLKALAEYMNR